MNEGDRHGEQGTVMEVQCTFAALAGLHHRLMTTPRADTLA
jgi:hypothetical protein